MNFIDTTKEKLLSPLEKLYMQLLALYNKMISSSDFDRLIVLMNTEQMKSIFSQFITDSKNQKDAEINEVYINLLNICLKICNAIYNYTGESTGLTDTEYDELVSYYENISNKKFDITEKIIVNKSSIVYHRYTTLRGTLDKIYKMTEEDVLKNKSQKSLEDWVKSSEQRLYRNTGKEKNLWDEEVIVMPKFDGVSCIFECDKNGNLLRALTRGYTETNEAQDVTHIFKDIFVPPFRNSEKEYGVKTEIMMLDDDLNASNELSEKKYKNTRSIVSSIMNSLTTDGREKYLKIIQLRYSYLNEDGTESRQELPPMVYDFPYIICKLRDVHKIHEFAFAHKTVYPGYRCDGAVIRFTNEEIQDGLGREDNKQKFEVAFKYTEEIAYSKVVDIEFSVGLFGRFSPVVVFEPIKMKGNTIERASLGSLTRFHELELCKGDTIKILYDIVPYADYDTNDENCKRSGEEPIPFPSRCPICNKPIHKNEKGTILYCPNSNCPGRIKGKILNYIQKMDIGNISIGTINELYDRNYLTKIEDLYTLENKIDDLLKIPGFGSTQIQNILDSIDEKKKVSANVVLGALGIEGVSTRTFKLILDKIPLKTLLVYNMGSDKGFFLHQLNDIQGISFKTASKVYHGLKENKKLIYFLLDHLEVLEEDAKKRRFTCVFTKVPREENMKEFIRSHGGELEEAMTKDVDFIVVPNLSIHSKKVEKAKKYQIPIVEFDNLKNYIEKNYPL